MKYRGQISFMIKNDKLDFEKIDSMIGIKPTKMVRKGQIVTSTRIAPSDIWRHDKKYFELEKIPTVLNELLDELYESSDFLKLISTECEHIGVTCYIVSDFGQIGVSLPNSSITKLNNLGLGIDFDILSYGHVEEN